MNKCLWCGDRFSPRLSWTTLFSIHDQRGFCGRCWSKFESLDGDKLCKKCGRDLKALSSDFINEAGICSDCEIWMAEGDVLVMNRSLFTYNDFMREVITRFKFRGDAVLAEGFGSALTGLYRKFFKECIPVPIPLSAERLAERSFNQAWLLASQLPYSPAALLVRTKHTEKQSKKSRRERLLQEDNPFVLAEDGADLTGRSFVIIDDIYTTGTTVRHAAHALAPLKPKAIYSMTLAR
ncbi:MAG: phosphoribosyltransferase family protein [Tuberibacillus sp.]